MKKVILDDVLRAKLFNLGHLIEFCDDNGRVIGYYSPVAPVEPDAYEGMEIPFTEEEIERFSKQEGGRPLADIFADLP